MARTQCSSASGRCWDQLGASNAAIHRLLAITKHYVFWVILIPLLAPILWMVRLE